MNDLMKVAGTPRCYSLRPKSDLVFSVNRDMDLRTSILEGSIPPE